MLQWVGSFLRSEELEIVTLENDKLIYWASALKRNLVTGQLISQKGVKNV